MTENKKAPDAIVVRRDSTTGKRVATIKGAGCSGPVKLAHRLVALLETPDERPGSRLFLVTFPQAPVRVFRATLVNHIEQALMTNADEDNEDNEISLDGWSGPRLTLPTRSGPSFVHVLCDEDGEDSRYCGFWLDPLTLVLADLDTDSPLEGCATAEVSHWHLDSWTSGLWTDEYVVLGNGLDVEWSFKDEDGTYIAFRRAAGNSPAAVAKRLSAGVAGWYIYRAETHLLTSHFIGFSSGTIELLRANENFGYEVESFSLHANKDVIRELKKRHLLPSKEEAGEWVQEVKAAVSQDQDLWENYTTGTYTGEFLLALIAMTEGKS